MFVPLWLIALALLLIAVLAWLALRGRGGDMIDRQRRAAPTERPPADRKALSDRGVREAIARGNKLEAIRLVRERTGLSLAEAKELVESQMD